MHDRFAGAMELPPEIAQPNVFPLSWERRTARLDEIWASAQREYWDPAKLPWETFDAARYTWEEREAIAYWWSLLSVFDASAPPVFAEALIKAYEVHEEDPVRRAFFSLLRDEQNHEQLCGMALTRLLESPSPLVYEPKTEFGEKAQRNVRWLYYNGARYWSGFRKAVAKYRLTVLFSSFLMGEIAAATIFRQMARGCSEPVFKEAFRNVGRDEERHMSLCTALMERDYPKLSSEDKLHITKQVRAGYLFLSAVLFEPSEEFWDLPGDFIGVQRHCEEVARAAGFGVPRFDMKKENWRSAMLMFKDVLERYDIAFPAIPEVGISGLEVRHLDMSQIIPVF
jgi:rubrerythrin